MLKYIFEFVVIPNPNLMAFTGVTNAQWTFTLANSMQVPNMQSYNHNSK